MTRRLLDTNRKPIDPKRIAVPHGYTLWHGGDCPVPPDANVDLFWADGDCEINERAGSWRWDHRGEVDHEDVADIIGYRTY